MAKMVFVDAHMHLWDLGNIRYPWLEPPFGGGPNGDVSPIAQNYLLEDYFADAKGWDVRGLVHVDAGAEASAALAETDWLQAMADRTGFPQGIVAFAPLNDPAVESLLAAHVTRRNVCGIRHIVNWHSNPGRTYTSRDLTQDPHWEHGYALLAKYGLSFDLQAYPGQFGHLAGIAGRHPDVPVIINHAGMPVDTDEEGLAVWRAGIHALARLPHVAVKLSGFGFVHRDWTVAQIRPFVRELIDIFGVERCMFASDFPTDKLFGSFARHLDAYAAIVSDFSSDEKMALFSRNAIRVYRLPIAL